MSYETILFEKKGAVAIVTLNRPAKKNAINEQMNRELIQIIGEVERDDEVKVMILTGGPECFSTGADLFDVSASESGEPTGPNPLEKLADMKKPTLAAISGYCVAGGLELALCCDLRIASETARIGDRHIRMGLIGGAGSATRLTRLVGIGKAMELILTGDMIDGKEAYRIGFANQVFPLEKFMEGALELAGKIASNSPLALKLSKKAVQGAADMEEYQSMHYTHLLMTELLASAEFRERIAAFLGRGKS
jgi:enoyl-CoA hydratase/carnithine racemase